MRERVNPSTEVVALRFVRPVVSITAQTDGCQRRAYRAPRAEDGYHLSWHPTRDRGPHGNQPPGSAEAAVTNQVRFCPTIPCREAVATRVSLLLVALTALSAGCASIKWCNCASLSGPGLSEPVAVADTRSVRLAEPIPSVSRGIAWLQNY